MRWLVVTDGGCTPNPGIGSCAYKITCGETGFTLQKSWKMSGDSRTNNEAEWEAISVALEDLFSDKSRKVDRVDIFSDSNLVINQLSGEYRIKDIKLLSYWTKCNNIIRKNRKVRFSYSHMYREYNAEMDYACKKAR